MNRARNFQEVSVETGAEICKLIDDLYGQLTDNVARKMALKEANRPKPFLEVLTSHGEDLAGDIDGEEDNEEYLETIPEEPSGVLWEKVLAAILSKVTSTMGRVLLACPFGSQRYNCHTDDSDLDMFVVYQSPTKSLLGFNPPQSTIKSREGEKYDYTILELHRYLELILAGDPRCVETLFLDRSCIYRDSFEYRYLCSFKQHLLTKQCVEKYLNDACGAKGLRLMDRWVKTGDALQSPMPYRIGKLFYIMIRLLQNAQDIVKYNTITVFRDVNSDRRKLLMDARNCQLSYEVARNYVQDLEFEVRKGKDDTKLVKDTYSKEVPSKIEKFLIGTRFESFKREMEVLQKESEY